MNEVPKIQYDKTAIVMSPPDEIHLNIGGEHLGGIAKAFAPDAAEIRRMLLKLRSELHWPRSFAARVLGVPTTTLAKWETKTRNPSGAASKLIFLLHALLIDKSGKIKNCWDLAVWGQIPCRNSMAELLLYATTWVPEKEFYAPYAKPGDSELFRPKRSKHQSHLDKVF